ncbi:Napsin-A [Aphelenchoides fujianensis]|nr:Napsin-A [Aphelenchoides fujianensis]
MAADRKANVGRSKFNSGSQKFRDYYAQTFQMQLDTASSNLWVVDASCESANCDGGPTRDYGYWAKHNRSSTFQPNGTSFSLWHPMGEVKGVLGADVLTARRLPTLLFTPRCFQLADGLSVENQVFALGTEIGDPFGKFPLDGVLGLGWPSLAADQVTPPIQDVLKQLDWPLFTIWLDVNVDKLGGTGGLITYGALDSTNCEPPLVYAPLTKEGFWQFAVDGFAVGEYANTDSKSAISDTGTAFILAPSDQLQQIIQQTGAYFDFIFDLYEVPCSKIDSFPDLIFTVNGQQLSLPASEYVFELSPDVDVCALSLDWNMHASDFDWLLGDVFSRTFCTIYDVGGEQVGFAKAPQQFQVEFDTDRASSWVLDDTCTDSSTCSGQFNSLTGTWKKQKFHRKESSTFQPNGTKFHDYAVGTDVYGELGVDTFVVGGISVKNQAFGMINSVDGYFPFYPYDGVLGLGWPLAAEDGETPVFQKMIPQLDAPIFTLWLDRHVKPSKGRSSGAITFGALDSTNCDAPLVYAPLTLEAEWVFNVDTFTMGDFHQSDALGALLDTSQTFLFAPFDYLPSILRQINPDFDPDYGLYTVPCSSASSLPDLVFTVGGQELHVAATEYVVDRFMFARSGTAVSEPLDSHEFLYYTGPVHVGTPPARFDVQFDTGSDLLWLTTPDCVDDASGGPCTAQKRPYDVRRSPTGRRTTRKFGIGYADGSYAVGHFARDVFGVSVEKSTQNVDFYRFQLTADTTRSDARGFLFGAADHERGMNASEMDGLLGLGFAQDSSPKGANFLQSLDARFVFQPPVFTVWLPKDRWTAGAITFGSLNDEQCGPVLTTAPVVSAVKVDRREVQRDVVAISDTSTSLLFVPPAVFEAIAREYPVGGSIDCNGAGVRGLKLELQVGGEWLVLDGVDLLTPAHDECTLGVHSSGGDLFLLGDVFIRKYCHVHDYRHKQVGFALANDEE